ncbi:hypothetical protein [Clostridium aminobutyricum]|uniref:Uncharacterized protein n=1 Tax=Clostridium aminobutyricum TaxID=33953 RepID=A0A939DBB4_CLOAM|nr:hypothetical protein [Clostridium aminobutyricum]MBN7774600.1 hypothetical protein [Clostridium aminobutyricum]
MLRKKFSTTMLALVVAAALPGSAFAADAVSESTGSVSVPTSVSAPVSSDNGIGGSEDASPAANESSAPAENSQAPGSMNTGATPAEGTEPVSPVDVTEPTTEVSEPTAEVTEPATEPQVPATEEQPAVEPQPTEEVIIPEIPAAEPQPIEDEVVPAVPAVEPVEVPDETILPIEEPAVIEPALVEEELVTEPAIVVEPAEATVTIVHRLYFGDKGEYDDYIEHVDGLSVGDELDLNSRILNVENVECVTSDQQIVLAEDNELLLEYCLIEE